MSISATADSLDIAQTDTVDNSIISSEYVRVLPRELAQDGLNITGKINFEINLPDAFLYIKDSYLLFEGELRTSAGAKVTDDSVVLSNNAMMHLLENVEYLINDKQVERIRYPRQTTTMISLLKYPQDYALSQGQRQLWVKDSMSATGGVSTDPAVNTGAATRRDIVTGHTNTAANKGYFSFAVPLSHILGFADSYDKVIYGAKHTLILDRWVDAAAVGAIFNAAPGPGVDRLGYVWLSSLNWFVPRVVPKPTVKLGIVQAVKKGVDARLSYMRREVQRVALANTSSHMIDLGNKEIKSLPKYVLVAFQPQRVTNGTGNYSVFDHLNVRDIGVEVGNTKFPYEQYNLDFPKGQVARAHREATKFSTKYYGLDKLVNQSFLSLQEFRSGNYTVFVIDTSRHEAQEDEGILDIKLRVELRADIGNTTTNAYIVFLGENEIILKSDGSRNSVAY